MSEETSSAPPSMVGAATVRSAAFNTTAVRVVTQEGTKSTSEFPAVVNLKNCSNYHRY
uniref:Uncharacterized protein n=1 Tax=Arundo donax TaxID=35708 RepID=A0A0A8ZLU3_ARUDO